MQSSGAKQKESSPEDFFAQHGAAANRVRHGESGPGNRPQTCIGGVQRRDYGNRAVGLSEPGQQCARLPIHFPRRGGRTRSGDQRKRWKLAATWALADIPEPFDPRLLVWKISAVAQAAMEAGVARTPVDLMEYRERLDRPLGNERVWIGK